MIENHLETQEIAQTPGLIATDSAEAIEKRTADLAAKFEKVKGNKYELGRTIIEIDNSTPDVKNQENGEYVITLKVSITDPNATGAYKNVARDSSYRLRYNKETKQFLFANRIDNSGPTYQIHEGELSLLKQTKVVEDVLNYIDNL